MNDNHTRHLLGTLRHIDSLLSEAEHVLATAGGASPFVECAQDSTPVQRQVIHDYAQHVRQVMRRGLQDLGLPAPKPVCGALWAASSRVLFARLAVAEMEPRRMGGYGPLSDEDARRINAFIAEVDAALERLAGFLGGAPAEDLQARLGQLDASVKGAGLLLELERIITAHGLVEFPRRACPPARPPAERRLRNRRLRPRQRRQVLAPESSPGCGRSARGRQPRDRHPHPPLAWTGAPRRR